MTERATASAPPTDPTADPAEVARFAALAEKWWDETGPFAPLHKFNPARLKLLRDRIAGRFDRDITAPASLAGLRLLDIGCGGGLLSEPMARLGAQVTGVDAADQNIAAARLHAKQSGLDIDYRNVPVESLADEGARFDVVLNMEVVEHVADVPAFLTASSACLAPGGLMFTATLNRTAKAYALAIVGAEYVLGWLPRGTHQWSKFLRPAELIGQLSACGLTLEEALGMTYNPITAHWSESRDLGVNYVVVASKPAD